MTDFPDLKLKALVSFPATVLDGAGIDVVKANGTYQFNIDYADFAPPVAGLPDPTNLTALLWNSSSNSYVLAPISLVGVSEAPSDGSIYGRLNAAWAKVLPLAGGTLTGPLILNADPSSAFGAATKQYVDAHSGGVVPSALTRTNDTNITLTLGGTPNTALLQATSITVGWSGTLSAARGGFGIDVSAQNGVPLFAAGVATFTGTTGTGNFVRAADPVLTGDPKAPTPIAGDNDTSIATTAFVATAALTKVGKINIQKFTASGTYTPSANLIFAIIECQAAGGGGGGAASTAANTQNAAGGGGGGGYSRSVVTGAAIGASKPVTVGAAGSPATAGNNPGGAGGGTSVGALCVANGGAGGIGAASGGNGTAVAGGAAGTGDLALPGGAGSQGYPNNFSGAFPPCGGAGGNSFYGIGGPFISTGQAGSNASGYGAGGGGGSDFNSGGNRPGGAGAPGIAIITEFCAQ